MPFNLKSYFALCIAILPLAGLTAAPKAPVFDVPKLDNIVIDGKANDWGANGFDVKLVGLLNKEMQRMDNYDLGFKLGWCEQGLLVFASVSDDAIFEADELPNHWKGDCVELWMSDKSKTPSWYKVAVMPGVTEVRPEMRLFYDDYRVDKANKPQLKSTVSRVKTEVGYDIEALMPWENLNISPKEGLKIGFQVYGDDWDDEFYKVWNKPDYHSVAMFYPMPQAVKYPERMHTLRLATKPSLPINIVALGSTDSFGNAYVEVTGSGEFAGKTAVIKSGSKVIGQNTFKPVYGRAIARVAIPQEYKTKKVDVVADGRLVDSVTVNETKYTYTPFDKANAASYIRPSVYESVFTTARFPEVGFERWSDAQLAWGAFTVNVEYYNNEFQKVKKADKLGRYGAVITVYPIDGAPLKFYRTICRVKSFNWDGDNFSGSDYRFPAEWGVPVENQVPEATTLGRAVNGFLRDSIYKEDSIAPLVAAIMEGNPSTDKITFQNDANARDRQWWLEFKRRESGMDKEYPKPFVCPTPAKVSGKVLQPGTEIEAGMKPGTVAILDEILNQWAVEGKEALAVCLVRNGVVFLHKAYGERDGKPMAVNDKSWMASNTKTLAAILFWELVDQGIASLDDPASMYIPELRGIEVTTPLTMRNLLTHTNGLENIWSNNLNELDNRVAAIYPFISVGKYYKYNGSGCNLASTAVEMITGEALPLCVDNHLLKPIGNTGTEMDDSGGGARSIPMDMARIGQLMLNGGTYGDKKFFSQETFAKMTPRLLDYIVGPDCKDIWGIGLMPSTDLGFGPNTYDHGAASGAILRMDPDTQMIVIQTRNGLGDKYPEFNKLFLEALTAGIEK